MTDPVKEKFNEAVKAKLPVAVSAEAYCANRPAQTPYLVNGIVFQGTATQLSGPIKDGKSTFLFAMVRKILRGEDFIGQKTTQANVLYVTEQPANSFQPQLTRSGLDKRSANNAELFILDVASLWGLSWAARAESIRENALKLNTELVIIDTFPRLALVEDIADAGKMNQSFGSIAPLVLTDKRTMLVVWHERKSGGSIGEAAAGTVASGGWVDMLLRLRRNQGAKLGDRTRQLEMVGRLPGAFEEAVAIVLNDDMTDYLYQGPKKAAARRTTQDRVLRILPMAPPGLTRDVIVGQLAEDAEGNGIRPPSEATVRRALEALMASGLVAQTGTGKSGRNVVADPFKYYAQEGPF